MNTTEAGNTTEDITGTVAPSMSLSLATLRPAASTGAALETTKPTGDVPFAHITEPPCSWILYSELNDSRVRIWDLMILIPNALFLVFLVWKLRGSVGKLQASSSPIFTAFYGLLNAIDTAPCVL
ncbi:hypothetical protein BaRGS_00037782 [Batillaria attramentaria]|uniref:Uncharacterized protein n=1 Tax=Batillaria attramentaria TaxID=370345 RepID=A0ABD0J922_9CAEN